MVRLEEERVLHVHRGVIRGEGQALEVVQRVLALGTLGHVEAE